MYNHSTSNHTERKSKKIQTSIQHFDSCQKSKCLKYDDHRMHSEKTMSQLKWGQISISLTVSGDFTCPKIYIRINHL